MTPYPTLLDINRENLVALAVAMAEFGADYLEPPRVLDPNLPPGVWSKPTFTQPPIPADQQAERYLCAASTFLYAATCDALLERWQEARNSFTRAATIYLKLHNPYHAITALAISDTDHLRRTLRDEHSSPEEFSPLVMAYLQLTPDRQATDDRTPPPVTTGAPVGQLGIRPRELSTLLEHLTNARQPQREIEALFAMTWIREVLASADDQVTEKQRDSYHWQRLGPPVFPIEPEAIALGAVAHRLGRQFPETNDLIRTLSDRARIPIYLAAHLAPNKLAR
jgi:hypothetical protein